MHPPLSRWAARLGVGALAVALLPLAPATAAPVVTTAPAAAPAPVAGGPSVGDSLFPEIGNTGYDVRHYAIALAYAKDGSIRATTTIQAKAKQRLSSFSLDLEGLTVDRVRVDGCGRDVHAGGHEARRHPRAGPPPVASPWRSATTARRRRTIDPDGSQDGWIPSTTGATALSEPVGSQTWFPNNNTPRDKAAFDVALTVPKKLAAASNGVLKSRRTSARPDDLALAAAPADGDLPLARGDREVRRLPLDGQAAARPSHPRVDLRRARAGQGRGAARSCCRRSCGSARSSTAATPSTPPAWSSRSSDVGYALETQTRPFFDERARRRRRVVHELAHQWYGDSVTPKDWGDIWLNEGFASYAEDNWAAEHGGPSTWESFQETYDANGSDVRPVEAGADAAHGSRRTCSPTRPTPAAGSRWRPSAHEIGDRDMRTLLRTWAKRYAGRYGHDEPVRRARRAGQRRGPGRLLHHLARGGGQAGGLLSRPRTSGSVGQAEVGAAVAVAPPSGSRRRQE